MKMPRKKFLQRNIRVRDIAGNDVAGMILELKEQLSQHGAIFHEHQQEDQNSRRTLSSTSESDGEQGIDSVGPYVKA
jgi:hypothetical protein